MNLKDKEKLKAKLDDLQALISCIDSSWTPEHSTLSLKHVATASVSHLAIISQGDTFLVINMLIRELQVAINMLTSELNQ